VLVGASRCETRIRGLFHMMSLYHYGKWCQADLSAYSTRT
jgi:hypothetical protein